MQAIFKFKGGQTMIDKVNAVAGTCIRQEPGQKTSVLFRLVTAELGKAPVYEEVENLDWLFAPAGQRRRRAAH